MENANLNPMATPDCHRLCDATRKLAARYLTGEYRPRLKSCGFSVNELNLPADTSPETIHGKNTLLTARKSRLDILPEERLAGSASNLEGSHHLIPGGGAMGLEYSISHTTPDFADAIHLGLSGLEAEIRGFKSNATGHNASFYDGLLDVIEAMRIWTRRYVTAYTELLETSEGRLHEENIRAIIATLKNVPENPPSTFREAVQSLWSFFEFQRLCGNWPGLGRLDWFLGPYLAADLAKGVITLDEARELLAHFWIKGTEWCFGLRGTTNACPGSGDAQCYQNVIIGGVDQDGNQIENEVTYLILDIVEELHISDYPVTVRLNEKTSDKLLKRIADVQLLGGGIVAVYNEPVILKGLAKLGFPEQEARGFTNDGCWEILIPGQTNFTYHPRDVLLPFQKALFAEKIPADYQELYQNYLKYFEEQFEEVADYIRQYDNPKGKDINNPGSWPETYEAADVVLSLVMPSCRKSGCSYSVFGTKYVLRGLHMGGLPDVVNSLYAIRKFVFEEKRLSLEKLVEILKNDWKGEEHLRQEFARSVKYYGNDNPEVDTLFREVFNDCTDILWKIGKVGRVMTAPGVSTFGREIVFAPKRMATAFGKHAHEYLAPNLSPTPGTDVSTLTSVINSYCTMDFIRTPNGAPLDLRLSADIRKVPNASELMADVLKVFLKKGGIYLQIDTVDPEMLKQAQKDPDRFPNLVVRISGWSARFASLDENWQNLVIRRSALHL